MHLSSGKPITQDEELANIELHTEHIKKALQWSIKDLERFIALLKARIVAEETYIQSLLKINKTSSIPEPEPCPYFGKDTVTSLRAATFQYEISLQKIVQSRKDLIDEIKKQIDVLTEVKEKQEFRRKNVKQLIIDRNYQYATFRTRDFVKIKKAYVAKCNELASAQQPIEGYEHIDHGLQPANIDEPRKSAEIDHDTDGSSINSLQESVHSSSKKKVSGLMAQMKTQFAAATAVDPSKQSARCAKIKKDIHDTDSEYRKSVQVLEKFRKLQMEGMANAVKNVEVVFLDKAEAIRYILRIILMTEQNALTREASLVKSNLNTVDAINSDNDVALYQKEYQNQNFITPSRVLYCNYYNGVYKDILFGSSLEEYAREHHRTVPLVISKCINAIEELGGLQKEGIYRISPRQTNVDLLKAEFEKDEENFEFHSQYDVFTIAAILKIYLRELGSPLLKYNVEERMKYSTIKKPQERLIILQKIVNELSPVRRATLEAVVRHLSKVAENANVNKMNVQNLSYMFTPAIFHDHNQAEHPGEWGSDLVFEDLLQYHPTLFSGNQIQQGKDQILTPISQGASSDFKNSLIALNKEKGNPPEGPAKIGNEFKKNENNNNNSNVDIDNKHIQFAPPPNIPPPSTTSSPAKTETVIDPPTANSTPYILNNNNNNTIQNNITNKENEENINIAKSLSLSSSSATIPSKENTPIPSSTPTIPSTTTTPSLPSSSPQIINDIPHPKDTTVTSSSSKEALVNKDLPKVISTTNNSNDETLNIKIISPQPQQPTILKDSSISPSSSSSRSLGTGVDEATLKSPPSSPKKKDDDKKSQGGGGLFRRATFLKSKPKQQKQDKSTTSPSLNEASPAISPQPETKLDDRKNTPEIIMKDDKKILEDKK